MIILYILQRYNEMSVCCHISIEPWYFKYIEVIIAQCAQLLYIFNNWYQKYLSLTYYINTCTCICVVQTPIKYISREV